VINVLSFEQKSRFSCDLIGWERWKYVDVIKPLLFTCVSRFLQMGLCSWLHQNFTRNSALRRPDQKLRIEWPMTAWAVTDKWECLAVVLCFMLSDLTTYLPFLCMYISRLSTCCYAVQYECSLPCWSRACLDSQTRTLDISTKLYGFLRGGGGLEKCMLLNFSGGMQPYFLGYTYYWRVAGF
jgi:hypothetical protein